MITIGVTGGIGSGKTTVCRHWERSGARVIYADELAKRLMTDHPGLKESIKKSFGEEAYSEDGELNRAYLSREAFEKGRVDELNRLVHPFVYEETDRLKKRAEGDGVSVLVKEAALLLQNGRPENLDFIVLVLADEAARTRWVAERDRVDPRSVQHRMQKQQDFSVLTHLADVVITNDGTLDELKKKAEKVMGELMEKD